MSAFVVSATLSPAVGQAASGGEIIVSLGPVGIARPASFFTNLALAVQCAWFAARLPVGDWRRFFLWACLGAFIGAFKHGFHHVAPGPLQHSVTAASNIALGLAVASAQRAVLPRAPALPRLQTLAILGVNAWTRSFGATAMVLLAGMAPVIVGSALAPPPMRTRLLCGWAVAASAGLAWAVGWTPAPWFNNTDVAHLALMAGLICVYKGARGAPWS